MAGIAKNLGKALDCAACAARGAVAILMFALFGLGGLVISPLTLLLRRPERCHGIVRAAWRLLVWAFRVTGLISVDSRGLGEIRGAVIAANHPTLIDVVLITALVPRTLFVAKRSLADNPFIAAIVRHTALPDSYRLIDVAAPYLSAGWNILVFPEGTRSPTPGAMGPLQRGVAQLALRTGAPVACIGIGLSRAILGKRQKPWDMGARTVAFTFASENPRRFAAGDGASLRAQADKCTAIIRSRIEALMQGTPG